MVWFVDIILHLDEYLGEVLEKFGPWTYLILFAIIFMETGLVITPFLPGDSLLFAAGALAGLGYINIYTMTISLIVAAIIGDGVNYWIGHKVGPKIFQKEDVLFLNKKYLLKAQEFYEKHGKKTIFLARFIPIIRTFAPFVAGIGKMPYKEFLSYNVIGAIVWVTLFLWTGYFFGNLTIVKDNFSLVVIAIIIISFIPIFIDLLKAWLKSRKNEGSEEEN